MGWSYGNYTKICITFLALSTFKITLDDIILHIIACIYFIHILSWTLLYGDGHATCVHIVIGILISRIFFRKFRNNEITSAARANKLAALL